MHGTGHSIPKHVREQAGALLTYTVPFRRLAARAATPTGGAAAWVEIVRIVCCARVTPGCIWVAFSLRHIGLILFKLVQRLSVSQLAVRFPASWRVTWSPFISTYFGPSGVGRARCSDPLAVAPLRRDAPLMFKVYTYSMQRSRRWPTPHTRPSAVPALSFYE